MYPIVVVRQNAGDATSAQNFSPTRDGEPFDAIVSHSWESEWSQMRVKVCFLGHFIPLLFLFLFFLFPSVGLCWTLDSGLWTLDSGS